MVISATEGHTVPWTFVKWWAQEMLPLVQNGYVATYDAYFVSPNGDAGMVVSLTCNAIGALTSAATAAIFENGNGNGVSNSVGIGGQPLDPYARPFSPP